MPRIKAAKARRQQSNHPEVSPPSSPEGGSAGSSEVASPVATRQQPAVGVEVRVRKKKNKENYKSFIYKVLKQIYVHVGISSKGMQTLNDLVVDMFERIAFEAAHLCKVSKRATLQANDIEAACKLIISGDLAKHAVTEGKKAIFKYENSKDWGCYCVIIFIFVEFSALFNDIFVKKGPFQDRQIFHYKEYILYYESYH